MATIGVIDVGIGNTAALIHAFKSMGCKTFICKNVLDIESADSLVLCGAGNFESVMKRLTEAGFQDALNRCKDNKKILGICVGAQILGSESEESSVQGLKYLNFRSIKFKPKKGFPVPNTGWRNINTKRENLNFGRMYFTHSYYFTGVDEENVLATAHYDFEYPVLLKHNNIMAAQFHPEKSHKFGMSFLDFWINT